MAKWAVRLAILLAPGMSWTLCASASQATEIEPAKPSAEVSVSLRFHGANAPSAMPQVHGIARWFGKEKIAAVPFTVEPGKTAALHLSPGRWVLETAASGYWAVPYPLELAEQPAPVVIDLWPAGRLEGELSGDGPKPPTDLVVFFHSAPGETSPGSAIPAAKVSCEVEKQTWHCLLPAALLDLRFQASGYVPRYQWAVRVEPGKTSRPGPLAFRQGSAVQGWVVTMDKSPVGEGAKVTLRPRVSGGVRDPGERKRLESLRFEASVNSRGFFQVNDVPPGAYLLEARHKRFAPAVVSVRVVPGEVTEIANPPLVLDFPKSVEVFVDPPVSPAGQAWSVKLQRLDRDASVVETFAEEAAALDGSWKKSGVPPGQYVLRVSLQSGETWWADEVKVDENLAPIYVRMALVTVKGMVRLGRKPLSATLSFGGEFGAIRVQAQSNEKGKFEVVLPRKGDWPVYVASAEPTVERAFPKLRIEPKPGTHVAEIDLNLPDTVLRGRVVDDQNHPLAKAIVSAQSNGTVREDRVQVWTDSDGRFEIRGLLPGPTLLEAEAGEDRVADPVSVDVEEQEDAKSWLLFARPQLRVSGTIVAAEGPVPGARVKAAPAGIPYLGVSTVTSDAQGRFQVRLPRATREMLLAVGAPGFTFRMLRVPVPENRNFAVTLEQTGGTLILEKERTVELLDPNAPMVYVLHGGSLEGLPYLLSWALSAGASPGGDPGRFLLPALEPGPYQACWALPAERPGLELGILPRGRCAGGTLAPGGELTLKIPQLDQGAMVDSFGGSNVSRFALTIGPDDAQQPHRP